MKKYFNYLIILGCFLFIKNSSFAAKFANQFVEFELPPQWQCQLEGAEWVCQSTNLQKKKDAIIVLAAKLKGDQDSIDQYLAYLKSAKNFTSVQGKPVKSEPKYAKPISVNSHPWVDSLHLESEIPGFYTRYLATVKEDIGVLVTYSIAKNKYQEYLKDFEPMVNTLKVFRKRGALNPLPQNQNLFDRNAPSNVTPDTVFPVNPVAPLADDSASKPKKKDDELPILWIAGAAAVIIILLVRRKKSEEDDS